MICENIFVTSSRAVWILILQPTPWLTSDILEVIQAKFKAKHHAEHTRDPADIDHYKTVKNHLKSMIRLEPNVPA